MSANKHLEKKKKEGKAKIFLVSPLFKKQRFQIAQMWKEKK
jgi:hypothetical protein